MPIQLRRIPKPRTFAQVLDVVLWRLTSALFIVGAVGWLFVRMNTTNTTGLWVEALLFATLAFFVSPTELLTHRDVLHNQSNFSAARHHRLHHKRQMREEWIFIPPVLAWLVTGGLSLVGLVIAWYGLVPWFVVADVCSFVFLRVLWQEVCHYLAHCPTYKPKAGTLWHTYVKDVTEPHQRHHTHNEEYDWEVSTLPVFRWAEALYRYFRRRQLRLMGPTPPPSGTTTTLGVISDAEGYIQAHL